MYFVLFNVNLNYTDILLRILQLFILNMRGLLSNPQNTLIGKSNFEKIDSKIRVFDGETCVLEIKNDSKVYVNYILNRFN